MITNPPVKRDDPESYIDVLEPMEKLYVIEYLKCWSPSKAAKLAGYTHPETQGPRVHKRPRVQAAIRAYVREKVMSPEEALVRLAEIARGDAATYIGSDGKLDLTQMKEDGKLHLIKEIKPSKHGGFEVKFYDAQRGVEKVVEVLGLKQPEKHQHLVVAKTEVSLAEVLDKLPPAFREQVEERMKERLEGKDIIDGEIIEE